MKIQELKTLLTQGRKLEELEIEIKPYIPVIEKKVIVERIIEGSINTDENGIVSVDYFNKLLLTEIAFINNYTNLEFSDEDTIGEYDYLVENEVVKWILDKVKSSELNFIYEMVYDELQQRVEIGNSLSNVVAVGINKLINKIPTDKDLAKLIKVAGKELKNFNPSKLKEIQEMMKVVN